MSFTGKAEFVEDNPARDTDDLRVYGEQWWDEAVTFPKYRLIYIPATNEVVVVTVAPTLHMQNGRIEILGTCPSVEEFEDRIVGWEGLERKELNWVRERLA